MSIDEILRAALLPLGLPVVPNIYAGPALRYIVYNYTELPSLHADGNPAAIVYIIQVHLYLPHGAEDTIRLKHQIAESLLVAGATYPSMIPAHDEEGQHYVFECQRALGADINSRARA